MGAGQHVDRIRFGQENLHSLHAGSVVCDATL